MTTGENLTGSLLAAHPMLWDPNFRRTIVFISQHCPEEGTTGFVLNRPVENPSPVETDIPVFFGGPVEPDQMIVASIQWRDNPDTVAFRTFTGMPTPEDKGWSGGMRIFTGYSGWSPGQLERELQTNSWVVLPPSRALIEMADPHLAWKRIMRETNPALHLLSEAPDDPRLN